MKDDMPRAWAAVPDENDRGSAGLVERLQKRRASPIMGLSPPDAVDDDCAGAADALTHYAARVAELEAKENVARAMIAEDQRDEARRGREAAEAKLAKAWEVITLIAKTAEENRDDSYETVDPIAFAKGTASRARAFLASLQGEKGGGGMSKRALSLMPQDITDDIWYYEENGGIHIIHIVRDEHNRILHTVQTKIPWRKLRASLARKGKL